jgi:hypothetical protein
MPNAVDRMPLTLQSLGRQTWAEQVRELAGILITAGTLQRHHNGDIYDSVTMMVGAGGAAGAAAAGAATGMIVLRIVAWPMSEERAGTRACECNGWLAKAAVDGGELLMAT